MSPFKQQCARIVAIGRRDLRTELSYQFQLFLTLGNVLSGVVLFYFVGQLVGGSTALATMEVEYFPFVLVGLITVAFAARCLNALSTKIQQAQQDDTLEILLATSTPLSVLMTGGLLVPLLLGTIEAVAYLVFAYLISPPGLSLVGAPIAILVLVLLLGTFAAVAIVGAALVVLAKRGDPISRIMLQISIILAGVYFPVEVLPDILQVVARFLPAFYGLRALRGALLTDVGFVGILPDVLALIAFNAVLLPVSLWVLGRAIRMAKITGTLGNR